MTSLIPPQFHLGSYLGQQAGQGLSKGIDQFFQNRQRQQQLSGLSPFLQAAGLSPEQIEQVSQSGIDPQQIVGALGHMQKGKGPEGLNQENIQESFNRLWELAPEIGASPLSPGLSFNSEKRAEFESQKGALVGALREMVNKGALTNQKFQYIVDKLLPSHGDRSVVKKGKLKGIAQTLGVNIPGVTSKKGKGESDGVQMRDPKTGKVYSVPKEKVNDFRQQGAELVGS